ncbi:MAG: ABC transporter ATP-binding protein [bacterium]|nr:ABC transporter ATP-binding protein [bacterium]
MSRNKITTDYAVEAINLVKSFGDGETMLTVLKSLNFSVKPGEFVAITGRSGSGKSTLMYQLGLLDDPTSGQIIIEGQPTNHLTSNEKTNFRLNELGYVFQDYALVPELTAIENVIIPLLMQGLDKFTAQARSIVALERVGLAERLHSLPAKLSGGEQQRVAIARAIAHEPKIIFADEPTANLDSETAKVVLDTFLSLHGEGQTIVMVTHEPEYATLTDRIVLLSDGIISDDVKQT